MSSMTHCRTKQQTAVTAVRTRTSRTVAFPLQQQLVLQLLVIIICFISRSTMSVVTATTTTETPTNDCPSPCLNGGVCQKDILHGNTNTDDEFAGIVENAQYTDMSSVYSNNGQFDQPNNNSYSNSKNNNGMVCVCPVGYVGHSCEIVVKECYDLQTQSCWNGQDCIPQEEQHTTMMGEIDVSATTPNSNNNLYCECDALESDFTIHPSSYTTFCSQLITQRCTTTAADNKNNQQPQSHYNCYNGGKCLSSTNSQEEQKLCECSEGWEGNHCQYKQGQMPQHHQPYTMPMNDENTKNQSYSSKVVWGSVMGVILTIASISFIVYVWIRQEEAQEKDANENSTTTEHQPGTQLSSSSFETENGSTIRMKRRTPSSQSSIIQLELADMHHTLDADGSGTIMTIKQRHQEEETEITGNNSNTPTITTLNDRCTNNCAEIVRTATIV